MIYEAFEEDGGLKRKMLDEYQAENNKMLIKLLGAIGLTFISAVIAGTIYITGIANKVDQHEAALSSGERFTQLDGQLLKIQIDANSKILSSVAQSSEVRELKEAFVRLDERLRNKGI